MVEPIRNLAGDREEAERRILICLREKKPMLDLGGLTLQTIPASVEKLGHLQNVLVGEVLDKKIPDFFLKLRKIASIQLMAAKGMVIPTWIGEMEGLKFINISNGLPTRFKMVCRSTSLTGIWFQHIGWKKIPEWIFNLIQLEDLMFHGDYLSSIDPDIGKLTALRKIAITNSNISELPQSFGALKNIETIDLKNNRFSNIPPVFYGFSALRELRFEGNNLKIPTEILASDSAQDILSYAKRLNSNSEARPLNEAKLILVGRGSVGKTTLVHRLIHKKFAPKSKTKGIKVSNWVVPGKHGDITAHIWDFGGQEIMHGTHQFFLTERSLYLLVLSGREDREDEDAEYWLKMIAAFGGESPVIIVLNKIKEHHFELNEEMLMGKYPNIRAFIETDCKNGVGLLKLSKAAKTELAHMDSVNSLFPAQWFSIKAKLGNMKESYMSFDEFRLMCESFGEDTDKGQEDLARFLHILGVALNYRDDSRLSETSILNPDWVTGGIYKIINDNHIRAAGGVVRLSDLKRILCKDKYPEKMHEFLIRLMQKFDLCFPLDDDGKVFLIPELLGKKQPKFGKEFDIKNCLNFEYHYGSLLPEGLIPRFIVRAYTRIFNNIRWRSGVVLEWKKAYALIKADESERQIVIRVYGVNESTRELLVLIRSHFDSIHSAFKKLKPVEKIRLPSHPNVLIDYAKVEAYAAYRRGGFEEYHEDKLIFIEAKQLVASFEAPGAVKGAAYRGAADSLELALGLNVVNINKIKSPHKK